MLNKRIKAILVKSYLLSIILLNLPGFFLLNKSLLMQRLAEIIWVYICVVMIVAHLITRKQFKILKNNHTFISLLLFFLISQTLSIIYAVSASSFFFRWEGLFSSCLFAVISTILIDNKKILQLVLKTLLYSFLPSTIIQLIIFFSPTFFINYIAPFLHPDSYNLAIFNIGRGRIYLENFTAVIIPVVFYYLMSSSEYYKKSLLFLLLILITFISIASNSRSVFVLTLFSIISSIYLYKNELKKIMLSMLIFIFLIFLFTSQYTKLVLKEDIIDRFFVESDLQVSSGSMNERINLWREAWDVGLSSPLVGIGLGNFIYNRSDNIQKGTHAIVSSTEKAAILDMANEPHNIFFQTFSETGFLGVSAITLLFTYFIKRDYTLLFHLKKKNNNFIQKLLIISFWSIFLYSLLNPASGVRFFALSWLFCVLIEKESQLALPFLK